MIHVCRVATRRPAARAESTFGLSPAAIVALTLLALAGCGKKGPPLPPLVRIPSPPADIKAERRGAAVDLQFALPSANTDGSRPANIERVDVYALSGPAPASDNEVLKAGVRVGTVAVKSPRDPNVTVDPDEPESDIEALEGPGQDQGTMAHVRELLTSTQLAGPDAATRTYVGIGISTRGRRGPPSKPVAVSLAAAPPVPSQPTVAFDETAVTVTWEPVASAEVEAAAEANPETEAGAGDAAAPGMAYHVYDVSPPPAGAAASPTPAAAAPETEVRLTEAPLGETTFVDERMVWNVERCYTLRAVRRVGDLSVEGDAAPRRCVTLKDTFPPAAPARPTAVASQGAINLIWTPGSERDLAGYRVWRAAAPSVDLAPVTDGTIRESTFTDSVQAGVRYTYAIQAVDTAGNVSALSAPVEETAR